MKMLLKAANANADASTIPAASARSPRLLEWLARLTQQGFSLDLLDAQNFGLQEKTQVKPIDSTPQIDDWNAVAHICGYSENDFASADAPLPLTAAEVDYFRRNHRGIESHIGRDFFTAQTGLPSPLAELYGLYRHRARLDAEASLWIAQSTSSTRVARIMADLLAIGAFANGQEYISYLGVTYSVPCAFDSSAEIDRANIEATRRLALPTDHPLHLLKMSPDELGVLAATIAETSALPPPAFLEKANLLAESRQDVNRLATAEQFATAVTDHDLSMQTPWVIRISEAYMRLLRHWVTHLPELQTVLD